MLSRLSSDAVNLSLSVVNRELSLLSLCRPTLFEIQLGQVDRGATLSWISQFPGEAEVLLPPLSNLEVVGEPFTMGTVRVVKLRVNVNLKVRLKPAILNLQPQTLNPDPEP